MLIRYQYTTIANLNCPRKIKLSNARLVSQTEEGVTSSETLSNHMLIQFYNFSDTCVNSEV